MTPLLSRGAPTACGRRWTVSTRQLRTRRSTGCCRTCLLETVLGEVILPYLRELGDRWERGEASVADEHFASNLLRGRLLGLARGWDQGAGPRALLACAPGEQHDLALIVFGLALRERGWRITFLGPDTPFDSLAEAARTLEPAAVVVVASSPERLAGAEAALRKLARAAPLWIAGAGASPKAVTKTGARHLDADPLGAADLVARAHREMKAVESEERAYAPLAIVDASQADGRRLAAAYWREVERTTGGLVRVRETPKGLALRALGAPCSSSASPASTQSAIASRAGTRSTAGCLPGDRAARSPSHSTAASSLRRSRVSTRASACFLGSTHTCRRASTPPSAAATSPGSSARARREGRGLRGHGDDRQRAAPPARPPARRRGRLAAAP